MEDVAALKASYEATIGTLKGQVGKLRGEVRILTRRLSHYEATPPIFPQTMLEQIKRVRALGVPEAEIAELYEIDAGRVERILTDMEAPLIVRRK